MRNTCIIVLIMILAGCANIMPPSGGPKDEDPPIVLESEPKEYTRNFKEKKIRIYFDEFIKFKDLQKKLIISPPVDKKPQIINRGKSLEIIFEEDLKENTTYTINFADAIVDNNEGNPIPQFEFVLSTGPEIDSLSISGMVLDAFTNTPAEGVFAMLYDNLNDSAPLVEVPYYVSKTNKNGEFTINNVKLDTFRLFILKDQNMNYKYDSQDELIGFSDSLVIFSYKQVEMFDTTGGDSVMVDSFNKYVADNYEVFLFKEKNKLQYLKDNDRPIREKILFILNIPLYDSVVVEPIYFDEPDNWYIQEKHLLNDTIEYWLTDTALLKSDTLSVSITYSVLDSMDKLVPKSDTVFLRYREKTKKGKKKNEEQENIEEELYKLELATSIKNGGQLHLSADLNLETSYPIASIDTSMIHFSQLVDSIDVERPFLFEKDSFYLRKYSIQHNWEEDANYKLFIEPNTFKDIYGNTNDTLMLSFSTRTLEYYGKLFLNMENINSPVIIQMLDKKDNVIREKYTSTSGILTFDYVIPASYKFKLIFDANNNKKWDTGDYLKHIQPENVMFYPGEINIRANWDVEQAWDISIVSAPEVDSIEGE